MPRVVKEADVRRDELLDTALALFLEHGYEKTSVEQITSAVGVAKGTFYHYFATKQELLEQLVGRFTDDLFTQLEVALSSHEGSAIDRFRTLMSLSTALKTGRKDETMLISSSLYAPENRELLDSLRHGWIDRTRPFIREIVEQGVAEGTFDVPDTSAMTEIWLSIWYDFGLRLGGAFVAAQSDPRLVDGLVAQTEAMLVAEERILGAPVGSLSVDVGSAIRGVLGAKGGS